MAWIPMEFWRPIETAPRDGSEVFVYRRIDPWNVYGIAHWEECHGIAGWISRALFDPPGMLGLGAPTHWRPMFTPPDSIQQMPRPDGGERNISDIKPCPFCGGQAGLIQVEEQNGAVVECVSRRLQRKESRMASRSLSKTILIGNVGRSETKFTPSGVAVTRFSVATSSRWKDKNTGEFRDKTEWHQCLMWRNENLANHIQAGKQVYIEGHNETSEYEKDGEKRYKTEVVVDDVILLGGGGKENGSGERAASAPRSSGAGKAASGQSVPSHGEVNDGGITDEDVPFSLASAR